MFEQIQEILRILNDNTEYVKTQLIQGEKVDKTTFHFPVNKELAELEKDTVILTKYLQNDTHK